MFKKLIFLTSFVLVLTLAYGSYGAMPGQAYNPNPANTTVGVSINTSLIWTAGGGATSHLVYFGTDYADVNEAATSDPEYKGEQAGTIYNPGLLSYVTTYYWRIDEKNADGTATGVVWSFTTSPYSVVENFDSYEGNNALRDVWKDWRDNDTASTVYIETTTARDGNSMLYVYENFYDPYYAEADADIADLGIDPDWLGIGAKALSLWFCGQLDNDAGEQMYIKLTDGNGNSVIVPYNGDMNDIRKEQWHQWNIAMTDFAGVNLANVLRITIGFGDGTDPFPAAGTGNVYFDDIRLYTTRCIPEYGPAGDITGEEGVPDCVVDFRDLKIVADEWLTGGIKADLIDDDNVNFKDFAVLANNWLEELLWP